VRRLLTVPLLALLVACGSDAAGWSGDSSTAATSVPQEVAAAPSPAERDALFPPTPDVDW